MLETTGEVVGLRMVSEKQTLQANGHDVLYVWIEAVDSEGHVVPDATIPVIVKVEGCGTLAGLGTGNPVTDEDYTDNKTVTYHGRALAIIRSGYEEGEVNMTVEADGLLPQNCHFQLV